jgi:hypothetical protein
VTHVLSRTQRTWDRYVHDQSDPGIAMSFVDLESCDLCMPLLQEAVLVA